MFGATRSVWWGFVLAFALGTGGCKPSGGGAISPQGFKHSSHAYQVKASADGRLMSDQWKLDNYQQGKLGYKAKSQGIYVVRYDLDVDGDGDFEQSSEELTYDLRFKHLVHDGVIFLRTIPISRDLEQKKLAVLMDRFVEEVAGAGYEVVQFNQQMSVLVEKRYAAAVVEEGEAALGNLPAYAATLEVANVDRIKVDPNARKERVQRVILHTPFEYKAGSRVNEKGKAGGGFPVLMLAGYANQPEDFDAGLTEFHDARSPFRSP